MRTTGKLILTIVVANATILAQSSPGEPSVSTGPTIKTVAERLGYPASSRLLVIHADDFGMLHAVNQATIEALNNRWITSASILVPCPWFPEAARFAREHPEWDLGIHLALNSEWTPVRWRPISFGRDGSSLTDSDGYMPLTGPQVGQQALASDAEREMRAQIETARAAGIKFTHLDTHMFAVATRPQLGAEYVKLGRSYGVPLLLDHHELKMNVQAAAVLIDRVLSLEPGVTADQWRNAYEDLLRVVPPGTYELIVHLAYSNEEMQAATYDQPNWGAQWRQNDFDTVKDPAFQKFLRDQGFILLSWRDLAKALPPDWKSSVN